MIKFIIACAFGVLQLAISFYLSASYFKEGKYFRFGLWASVVVLEIFALAQLYFNN